MWSRSEDLSCPVCHETFSDPVVLSCSHSFCRACLQRWWRGKTILECPVCKRRSSKSDPPRNLALKNLCEAFLQEEQGASESKRLCRLHSEKLKLFCLDHLEPVCLVCRDSKTHHDHRFRPIDEAAQDHREELQKILKPFQENLELQQDFREECGQTLKFLQVQTQQTERGIREQFKKLQLFLQQEEEERVSALRTEAQQKTRRLKEKMEALSSHITALSATVRAAEEQLRAEDTSFLQNYKTTVRRVQQHHVPGDPEPISGALIDVVTHLGNLDDTDIKQIMEMISGDTANKASSTSSCSPALGLEPGAKDTLKDLTEAFRRSSSSKDTSDSTGFKFGSSGGLPLGKSDGSTKQPPPSFTFASFGEKNKTFLYGTPNITSYSGQSVAGGAANKASSTSSSQPPPSFTFTYTGKKTETSAYGSPNITSSFRQPVAAASLFGYSSALSDAGASQTALLDVGSRLSALGVEPSASLSGLQTTSSLVYGPAASSGGLLFGAPNSNSRASTFSGFSPFSNPSTAPQSGQIGGQISDVLDPKLSK